MACQLPASKMYGTILYISVDYSNCLRFERCYAPVILGFRGLLTE